jgi:hypothetical protein
MPTLMAPAATAAQVPAAMAAQLAALTAKLDQLTTQEQKSQQLLQQQQRQLQLLQQQKEQQLYQQQQQQQQQQPPPPPPAATVATPATAYTPPVVMDTLVQEMTAAFRRATSPTVGAAPPAATAGSVSHAPLDSAADALGKLKGTFLSFFSHVFVVSYVRAHMHCAN